MCGYFAYYMQTSSFPVILGYVQSEATGFQGQMIMHLNTPLKDILKVKRDILNY
jgi:hypothetical protein